jgi:hypothetical protein
MSRMKLEVVPSGNAEDFLQAPAKSAVMLCIIPHDAFYRLIIL